MFSHSRPRRVPFSRFWPSCVARTVWSGSRGFPPESFVPIHIDIRSLEHLGGRHCVALGHRGADRRGDRQGKAADGDGRGDRCPHPRRDDVCLVGARVFAEHDELVSAESGDDVVGACCRNDALTDEGEQ